MRKLRPGSRICLNLSQNDFSAEHLSTPAAATVIRDNTGTMHRALLYEAATGRTMHRTSITGAESVRTGIRSVRLEVERIVRQAEARFVVLHPHDPARDRVEAFDADRQGGANLGLDGDCRAQAR